MFDQFLKDAASGYWWLSVVIVGLIINLASSYLKDAFDAVASRVSRSAKKRYLASQEKLRADAEKLKDIDVRIELRLDMLIMSLQALMILAGSILVFCSLLISQTEALRPFFEFPFTYSDQTRRVVQGLFVIVGNAGLILSLYSLTFVRKKMAVFNAYHKLSKSHI